MRSRPQLAPRLTLGAFFTLQITFSRERIGSSSDEVRAIKGLRFSVELTAVVSASHTLSVITALAGVVITRILTEEGECPSKKVTKIIQEAKVRLPGFHRALLSLLHTLIVCLLIPQTVYYEEATTILNGLSHSPPNCLGSREDNFYSAGGGLSIALVGVVPRMGGEEPRAVKTWIRLVD